MLQKKHDTHTQTQQLPVQYSYSASNSNNSHGNNSETEGRWGPYPKKTLRGCVLVGPSHADNIIIIIYCHAQEIGSWLKENWPSSIPVWFRMVLCCTELFIRHKKYSTPNRLAYNYRNKTFVQSRESFLYCGREVICWTARNILIAMVNWILKGRRNETAYLPRVKTTPLLKS